MTAHVFSTWGEAQRFCDKKNNRTRKYKWIYNAKPSGGFVAWKIPMSVWKKGNPKDIWKFVE